MHIQSDRAFVPAGTPAMRYLHVTVVAPARQGAATRPPASISLVLDRSGSMDGMKFTMARQAVAHAVKLLAPTDHLGIVCYDEQITTVLDRTPATKDAKRLALSRLAEIGTGGATDLHGGWQRGVMLARADVAKGDGISKVMLLTDGLANHGITDHAELIAAARQMRNAGVLTSTFGVGRDFDEELLARMATESGGHFYFIEQPKQIPDLLASELGETLEVTARDVEVELALDPGVGAGVINDLPTEREPDRLSVRLGDLVADQEISFVIAVMFKGSQPEGARLGVRCSIRDRDGAFAAQPMEIMWEAVEPFKDAKQSVDKDVVLAAASVLAERARREALAQNAAGNFDAAKRTLQEVLNDLRALAQDDKRVLRLIDAIHREELVIGDVMDPMARKARHFASYQAMHSREAGGAAKRTKRR